MTKPKPKTQPPAPSSPKLGDRLKIKTGVKAGLSTFEDMWIS
ncbi:MAG: hypothetical protein R3B09_01095 [Nannocystaceae bacterium]